MKSVPDFAAAVEAANLRGQAARMPRELLSGPKPTGQLAQQIACSNLSDCAARANEKLIPLGVKIVARMPTSKLHNRFGEKTNQHFWELASAD
ncbi:MAG: hypothetical protein AAGI88_15465 [Pseudomonadota bacterium]